MDKGHKLITIHTVFYCHVAILYIECGDGANSGQHLNCHLDDE